MILQPWAQRLAEQCTDAELLRFHGWLDGYNQEADDMGTLAQRFPDKRPHVERFYDEMLRVMDDHFERGELTIAEVVGVLELLKQVAISSIEEQQ